MFKKKETKDVDNAKVNEVISLASKVLKIVYGLLILVAVYLVLLLFKETKILSIFLIILKVIFPFFIGLIFAWLCDPVVKWFEIKLKLKRTIGVALTYTIMIGIIVIIIMTFIPLLAHQVTELAKIAPDIFDTVKEWCINLVNNLKELNYIDVDKLKDEFLGRFNGFASQIGTYLPNVLISFFTGIFSGIGTIVIGLIIGFFILIKFDSASEILNLLPKKYRKTGIELAESVNKSLRRYVLGLGIDCTLIFILSTIGFWIVGLQAPALFAFFCAITNIIPYVGPYIGGAPAVIVGLTQSPTIGILVLAIVIVVQFIEGNFIQPYIMSKTVKVHPVTIMLGLLVFGYFFGIIGMLISTPVIAVIKTIFQFYDNKYGLMDYTIIDSEIEVDIEKVVDVKKK